MSGSNESLMPNKMLIDASHPEETRVVVLRGNRVEEFDFEAADKKQLRGNIYLAKVTRVEPSLQAAFVDYGGNRHGFLAFPEIHPDYYQIPVVDRQALIEDEARAQRDEDEDEQRAQRRSRRFRHGDRSQRRTERRRGDDEARGEVVTGEVPALAPGTGAREDAAVGEGEERTASSDDTAGAEVRQLAETDARAGDDAFPDRGSVVDGDPGRVDEPRGDEASIDPAWSGAEDVDATGAVDNFLTEAQPLSAAVLPDEQGDAGDAWSEEKRADQVNETEVNETEVNETEVNETEVNETEVNETEVDDVEQLGGDAMEEVPVHRHRYRRQYTIQEVIKRRQILLVQVVKEERGNKGAALTTYLSLAGRYSVLMPNTARGGGISRKITDATDRQRLKSIVQELEVPEGMGVILRTAGAARTKAEVKRDFEYLLRMWETVRETTLRSTAPTLVYEEGSLIKRAIRDLYNKDIDEVVVAGEDSYREAKEFMRLLMPSHAKNIQPYRDAQPVFAKHGVEAQLDAMFSNKVTLRSGGYIVINQTEALVAIDVNSGRSTREHNIEDTALRTNLEAVEEIARQLRLRDLAGLIVLDLIDMEESRNNRAVERRLKDALKNDRARIQVGAISHFGLLEMSRQRIRSGVLEASTVVCPHCAGAGTQRSTASIALHILRVIEDALIKNASYDLVVKAGTIVALYILNQKRAHLSNLETRFGVAIAIEADESLAAPTYYALERGELAAGTAEPAAVLPIQASREANGASDAAGAALDQEQEIEAEADGAEEPVDAPESRDAESEAESRTRRRRRRRRGRGGDREVSGIAANAPQPPDDALGVIARIARLEPQASIELLSDAQPELPLPAAIADAPAAEPAVPEAADRRRSRRTPRAPREILDEPAHETHPEGESAADGAAGAPGAGVDAEVGAEAPRPARARRGRRAPKARGAEDSLAVADAVGSPEGAEETATSPAEPVSVQEPVAIGVAASAEVAAMERAEALEPNASSTPEADAAAAQVSSKPTAHEPAAALGGSDERPKRSGWWQRAKASSRS
jgi:ribonuclease E